MSSWSFSLKKASRKEKKPSDKKCRIPQFLCQPKNQTISPGRTYQFSPWQSRTMALKNRSTVTKLRRVTVRKLWNSKANRHRGKASLPPFDHAAQKPDFGCSNHFHQKTNRHSWRGLPFICKLNKQSATMVACQKFRLWTCWFDQWTNGEQWRPVTGASALLPSAVWPVAMLFVHCWLQSVQGAFRFLQSSDDFLVKRGIQKGKAEQVWQWLANNAH